MRGDLGLAMNAKMTAGMMEFKVVLYVIRKNPPKKRTRDKKHVQTCTREHLRAKPISFLE